MVDPDRIEFDFDDDPRISNRSKRKIGFGDGGEYELICVELSPNQYIHCLRVKFSPTCTRECRWSGMSSTPNEEQFDAAMAAMLIYWKEYTRTINHYS